MSSAETAPESSPLIYSPALAVHNPVWEWFAPLFRGRKMNLGCGPIQLPDYINVDLYCDADVKCDIRKPWPFKDGSFDTIFASHILEHFSGEQALFIFSEMGRVLTPGGHVIAAVPYGRSAMHYCNPFHQFGWTENTLPFLDSRIYKEETGLSFRREQGQHMYPWTVVDVCYRLSEEWRDKPSEERKFAARHYQNVIDEMFFAMRRERE